MAAASIAGASSGAGAGVASLFTATGVGIGSIFVAAALILVLAYLNLLDGFERDTDHLRTFATAVAIPLYVTFIAVVVFEALVML